MRSWAIINRPKVPEQTCLLGQRSRSRGGAAITGQSGYQIVLFQFYRHKTENACGFRIAEILRKSVCHREKSRTKAVCVAALLNGKYPFKYRDGRSKTGRKIRRNNGLPALHTGNNGGNNV